MVSEKKEKKNEKRQIESTWRTSMMVSLAVT
jgi:hypothetical protein